MKKILRGFQNHLVRLLARPLKESALWNALLNSYYPPAN